MPSFVGADYFVKQSQQHQEADPHEFDNMSVDQLTAVVTKAALSNSDLSNDAIRRADSYSFGVTHPELLQTAKNVKLINHWLTTRGITNPQYHNFDEAYQALTAANLLELDKAELARDKHQHRTSRGVLSGQTCTSIDELITVERGAALQRLRPEVTAAETALANLPIEQVQTLLRDGERQEHRKTQLVETQKNGDAWLMLNPWFVDNQHNAHLMAMQFEANGFSADTATIEQYEICGRQLRESGLLTLNKTAVAKEQAAEVAKRAAVAVKQPGTVFDTTTEDEMYNLPLEELKRRANGIYA